MEDAKWSGTWMDRVQNVLNEEMGTFEIEQIRQNLNKIKRILLSSESLYGFDIRRGLMCFADYFLNQCQKLDETVEYPNLYERFELILDHSITMEDLFERFSSELTTVYDKVLSNIKNRDIRPILYAKQYIEENKGKNIKLEELAKTVGFSYAYFSSLFKKETGQTLTDYIQNTRIKEAKQLLVEKDTSISEVALQAGYNDVKFFTKQFKKAVGISPNEYHKMFVER